MKFSLIILSVLTLTFTAVTLDTWAVNQVLDLDGGRDDVEIPPSDSLDITGAITLEGWVFHKAAETHDWSQAWLSKRGPWPIYPQTGITVPSKGLARS